MTIGSSCNYGPMSAATSYGLGKPVQNNGVVGGAGQSVNSKDAMLAKLQQTDPALAEKIQGIENQIQDMKASGASKQSIGQVLRSNFQALSSTEQSEIRSASGGPHHTHRHVPIPSSQGSANSGATASNLLPVAQNKTIFQMVSQIKPNNGDTDGDGDSA